MNYATDHWDTDINMACVFIGSKHKLYIEKVVTKLTMETDKKIGNLEVANSNTCWGQADNGRLVKGNVNGRNCL